jgi:hypothetical protein
MNIRFYTENLKYGEIACFCLILDAPYGEHHCNGVIIHSQREDGAVVLWPKLGAQFAHSPGRGEWTRAANEMILNKFREWSARK